MSKVICNREDIVAIANAVRNKTGNSNEMTIGEIVSGVSDIPLATAPTISVSGSGLITATSGNKSATKQLATQAAKTITPSTSSQTAVASGVYTTGAVTVVGDANLKAENIAEGISIFGVTGTHSSGGSSGGSVETCTVDIICNTRDISPLICYTAFENGFLCKSSAVAEDIIKTKVNPNYLTDYYYKYTLTNVVCNSTIVFYDSFWCVSGGLDVDGTAELYVFEEYTYIIKAPSVSGETCNITIS